MGGQRPGDSGAFRFQVVGVETAPAEAVAHDDEKTDHRHQEADAHGVMIGQPAHEDRHNRAANDGRDHA